MCGQRHREVNCLSRFSREGEPDGDGGRHYDRYEDADAASLPHFSAAPNFKSHAADYTRLYTLPRSVSGIVSPNRGTSFHKCSQRVPRRTNVTPNPSRTPGARIASLV